MGLLDTIKSGLENIGKNLFKSTEEKLKEALETISDPFAKEISWEPLAGGGTNFKTNSLILNSYGNLEYKPSAGAKIFLAVFLIIPIIFISIGSSILFNVSNNSDGFDYIVLIPFLLFPLIFIGVGYFLYKKYSKPIIFDKSIGYFYKGKPTMNLGMIDINDKKLTSLNNIYAIQLLSEYVSGNKSSYYSYEINLILKDKTRINVIDHGNLEVIKTDAKTIGDYLGVPVWDLTSFDIY